MGNISIGPCVTKFGPALDAYILTAGFYVCKLKKLSNAPKRASNGEDEEAQEEEEEVGLSDLATEDNIPLANGRQKKRKASQVEQAEGIHP